jgi:hypothetical protein
LEALSAAVIGPKPMTHEAMTHEAMTHLVLPNARPSNVELFLKLALASGVMVAGLDIGYLLCSPLPYDPIG